MSMTLSMTLSMTMTRGSSEMAKPPPAQSQSSISDVYANPRIFKQLRGTTDLPSLKKEIETLL
jgi:hypothetical protein